MSFVKKRTAGALLKAAKRMTKENNPDNESKIENSTSKQREKRDDGRSIITRKEHQRVGNSDVRIVENKRNHDVPEYIKLSPSEFMSYWITSTGAKRKASNMLLKYLKFKFDVDIASDYRTLLRTPVTPVPKYKALGSYVHLGVHQALKQLLTEAGNISSSKILMQFFVDGLRISRSTNRDLWIIMMNIRKVTKRRLTPKVIGIYYDETKPKNFNEFLWPFVMELLEILESGFVFNEKSLELKILNFVLDAPARTSCKAIKHINGYNGCDYCLAEGDSIDHRMCFLNLTAPLRNDRDYRDRKYEDYHKMESVLELLPIDMIDSFPPDYLHCLLLGIMHWVLGYLRDTSKVLSSADYIQIEERIKQFRLTEPLEFQRNLRSFVDHLGYMKGTEFRQYLLFVFPILLEGIVSEEIIVNFLKLHIASIIFTHKRFECYYEEADELVKMYLTEFAEIYHPRHLVYVFHSLAHMKRFVEMYGAWDNFSTFEYESYNSTVKNLLHGNVMPLTQITNRIVEIYNTPQHNFDKENQNIEIKERLKDGSFAQLKFYDLTFKTNCVGQNYILLKSGEGVKLTRIIYNTDTDKVELTGYPFKHRSSVYTYVDTMRFNIFKSQNEFKDKIYFAVDDIDGKLWKLKMNYSEFSAYYPIYVENGKSFSGGHEL